MAKQPPYRTPDVPHGAFLVFNQTIYPIIKPITHIGRKPDNDIVIKEPSVSRFHAQVRVENSRFLLHDLNSHNGVIINKTRVNKIALKPGMLVYLGDVMLVFVQEDKAVTDSLEKDTGELMNL